MQQMSIWHDLLETRLTRRVLLKASAAAAAPLVLRCVASAGIGRANIPFRPIAPTSADTLTLAEGFSSQILASFGDDIGNGSFGMDSDFTAFFPIDLLDKGFDLARPHFGWTPATASSTEGLLVVSHETPMPMFGSGYSGEGPKTAEQIRKEHGIVGLSVMRVANRDGRWQIVKDSPLNRRYDGLSHLQLTGPAATLDGGPAAVGTIDNCSGGVTPWGTALSGEENIQDYTPAPPVGYGWPVDPYDKRHYGYIVEVDPFDPAAMPRKHTAMGRFRHENVAIRVAPDGTVAAYMGDDKRNSCVYKFVAERKLTDLRDRASNMDILTAGRLYVANFGTGRWLLLDHARDEKLQKRFASQAEVLADARAAGLEAGGTPVDRPEDIEVHPVDGSVYVSLTNNYEHGNFHGHIVRILEDGNEPGALTFDWDIIAVGGAQSGFSCPDNLLFDAQSRLWMCSDVSDSDVGRGIYEFQGNNSLYLVSTSGDDRGSVYRFASAPHGAEMTGPSWTPDGKTLFLSIQHPGGDSKSLDKLTSHWPDGGDAIPRGSVVAITGF